MSILFDLFPSQANSSLLSLVLSRRATFLHNYNFSLSELEVFLYYMQNYIHTIAVWISRLVIKDDSKEQYLDHHNGLCAGDRCQKSSCGGSGSGSVDSQQQRCNISSSSGLDPATTTTSPSAPTSVSSTSILGDVPPFDFIYSHSVLSHAADYQV